MGVKNEYQFIWQCIEKCRARLVVKGYSQVEGIGFGDIFSPTTKLTSIMFLYYVVTSFDLEIE